MAFPAKNDAAQVPPPLRPEERNWTCADEHLNGGVNQCDAVLKGRFVGVRTDPKDPKKFVPICEKCAKLAPVGPPQPTHRLFCYLAGLLTTPIIYGIGHLRGWW